ncbi:MAG: metal ABC transporter substrate-binding protein [Candidatus Dojkabacteria bacterium]
MGNKFLLTISLFAVIALTALVILNDQSQTFSQDESVRPKVAASIFPIADITRNVAGEQVDVIQILPSGVSPHTHELTVRERAELQEVGIIFAVGLGLDNWATDAISGPQTTTVEVSDGIDLKENDPYYWLSVSNAVIIAGNVRNTLTRAYPEHTDLFNSNYESYVSGLRQLRNESVDKISSLRNKKIITFHDAFGYFADDLGLEIAATIEPFAGKEPTSAYLAGIGDVILEEKVTALFREPQLSDSILKPLADDYGATVSVLDPLGGTNGRQSYIELITYNVNTVVDAF